MPLAHPLISFRWQAPGLKLTGTLGGSAPKLYDPWFTFRTVPWGLEESQRTLRQATFYYSAHTAHPDE